MTPQRRLKVAATLAAALKTSGILEGRIRIQKIAYLLQQKGLQELSEVDFVFHHYGPYSEEVSSVLSQAVAADIIIEQVVSFDDEWQRFEYSLAPKGADYLSLIGQESMSVIESVVDETKSQHWRTLELAATVLFFQKRDGLDMAEAMGRALSLKPACHGYEKKTMAVLTSLKLA
jgi:uncharacterized protein YwgA